MRHRGMLRSATIAALCLSAGVCLAQTTTQPAKPAGPEAGNKNLVNVETNKEGGAAAPSAAPAKPAGQEAGNKNLENVETNKEGDTAAPSAATDKSAKAGKGAADANSAGKGGTTGGNSSNGLGGIWIYVVLLGGFVLLYVWMGRSRRKQEAKRKEMLGNLKKNDKIVTIGGIIGTVIEARPEEITIKVDETSNVRMKFARWAVRGVGEEGRKEPEEKK